MTMTPSLRPMNLGEILDRAFEIYRKRFWFFVAIGALPATAMLALHLADLAWVHTDYLLNRFTSDVTDSGYSAWRLLVSFVYSHILSLLLALFLPALLQLTSREVFGHSITVVAALRFTLLRWRSYLWLAFLLLVAATLLPESLAFGVFFATGTLEDKLRLLGEPPNIPAVVVLLAEIPAGFVLVLWAKACLSFSIPAAAFEDRASLKALRRSWSLTKNSRGRIVLAWLATMACYWVLSAAAGQLLAWAAHLFSDAGPFRDLTQHRVSEVRFVLNATLQAFVFPVYAIAGTLLYYDQRVRKEGYDLDVMMEAAGLTQPQSTEVQDPVRNAETEPSRWDRVSCLPWD